jgi:hypothetical protein
LFAGAVLLSACIDASQRPTAIVNGEARLSSAAVDPCDGTSFDADNADPRCIHHGVGSNTPPADALRVSLSKGASVRSGYDAGLSVDIVNVSKHPVSLDMDSSCGTFEGQASNGSTNSYETDCLGLCENGPEPHVLRVTLEPGGVIHKKVKFYAVQTRVVMNDKDACVTRSIGALPPGDYDLQVTLPWTDPVPGDPGVTRPRVLESKLTVTP